jgi:hypothetical protein
MAVIKMLKLHFQLENDEKGSAQIPALILITSQESNRSTKITIPYKRNAGLNLSDLHSNLMKGKKKNPTKSFN